MRLRPLSIALVALLALAMTGACKKRNSFVPVPGWQCRWDEDSCQCSRIGARFPIDRATHPACDERDYPFCVASASMGDQGLSQCICVTGGWKLSDGDTLVSQCPPLPQPAK